MKLSLHSIPVLLILGFSGSQAADQYFGGGGALNGVNWGAASTGPFSSSFTSGNVANFAVASGTGTGASLVLGGINATEDFTLTSASGTLSNTSNGVIPISVSAGKTLDFGSQAFTSSSTAGYVKNGDGVLALSGGTYGGGFVLNAGTVLLRGVNGMGGGSSNTLAINGGTIAATASRDLTGKFNGGISIGGDFQLGSSTGLSGAAANIVFSNNMALGSVSRTITLGANGTYTLGGVISAGAGAGLTVSALSGAAGTLALTGANTYSGPTRVTAGTLAVSGAGSISSSSGLAVASGAKFSITSLTAAIFGLGPAQTLSGDGLIDATGKTFELSGTLAPENTMDVTGVFTLQPSATAEMDITGNGNGDRLAVAGLLTLGGSLNLHTAYTPALGDSVDLLDWGTISGSFGSITGTALGGGLAWDTSALYTTGVISVVAVPEPSSLMLFMAAGTMAVLSRRRRAF